MSGGNQQKVVLARWLLRRCRVLLLDEPTRGVDVATKAEIYRIVCDLANSGLGVLMVSSELEELVGICTPRARHARGRDRRRGAPARRPASASCCATPWRRPTPPTSPRRWHDQARGRAAGRRRADPARDPNAGPSFLGRVKGLELQEYALGDRRRPAVRGRRDPQAGHVPDLGQRPQHAHAGERRRRARDRHDVRDRDGGHRPVGRLDGRGGRRLRRRPDRPGRIEPRLHPRRDRVRDGARRRQRDRDRLRPRGAVHRDARDVLDRARARAAAERQAAGRACST